MTGHILRRAVQLVGAGLTCWVFCGHILALSPAFANSPMADLDADFHAQAIDQANRLTNLRSLLLSVNGELVLERYFRGAAPTQWANVKSVSKSILSTLVGIALDRGHLGNLHDPIEKFFPDYFSRLREPAKKTITIEDLLTMRSGLETTSNRNYGKWVQSSNWVRHVLTRPMVGEPGGRMVYSTGNSHLLAALLTRTTGMTLYDFARRYLADPLGIEIRPWARDPQGVYFGGNEMHLTPRAMLAIGELYVNGGRANGTQVVSPVWVSESFRPRTQSQRSGRAYGYGWWIGTVGGRQVYYAWGHGGQFIFVVPELKMVAVTTSALSLERQERRAHRRAIHDLIDEYLVPAVISEPVTTVTQ